MNELQKLILQSIIKKNDTIQDFIDDVTNTFQIKALCDMLEINRNRYNYLVRSKRLQVELLRLYVKVELK